MTYDLMIIGGGPAGAGAAVYAARKQLKTIMLVGEFGGQSSVSPEIYNWIGTPEISGADLAKSFKDHVMAYEGDYLDVRQNFWAQTLTKSDGIFVVSNGTDTVHAKTVLIASGSRRRKLDVPGADSFENKGVVYCASCDGPLFSGQDVVVVGGGNAGFESAAQLSAYCKSVTLLHRSAEFRADEITVNKVLAKENVTALTNTEPTAVIGEKFVTGVSYRNKTTGETGTLPVGGVFVEIGQIPNTQYASDLIDLDAGGRVPIDFRTQQTSVPGVWAAGDCTDVLYHQNNIACGDAVRALEDIYVHLHTK